MKKATIAAEARQLEQLPNVGASMVAALQQLGIHHCTDLIGQDPYALHCRLTEMTPRWRDPCVIDTFIAAIRFMEGAPPQPWWAYTAERKQTLQRRQPGGNSAAQTAKRVSNLVRKTEK